MTRAPTAEDLAEVASGKGSARDKREAAAYRRKHVGGIARGRKRKVRKSVSTKPRRRRKR